MIKSQNDLLINRVPGKKHRALIQLGSFGDLVNLMPICKAWYDAGDEVYIVTRREYAPILNSVTYVKAVIVDIPNREPFTAEKFAKDSGCFDEVIVTQVCGNNRRYPIGPANWQVGEWVRCGMLDKFHEFPTIFDNRDRDAEREALAAYLPVDDGRPLLAYNFRGASRPYARASEQREWINATFGAEWRIVDLGSLNLANVALLLPFIEAAQVLITVDTATVHLAHATNTAVIVFQPEDWFARSEPRENWIFACTHENSIRKSEREAIVELMDAHYCGQLVRSTMEMTTVYVWHAVEYYWDDKNSAEKSMQMDAYRSWDRARFEGGGYFRTIFTEREASAVEVIDKAVAEAEPSDAILWTSRFTHVTPEMIRSAREVATNALGGDDCWRIMRGRYFMCRAGDWPKHQFIVKSYENYGKAIVISV